MIDCGTTGFMGPTHTPALVLEIVFYVEIDDEVNSAVVIQCSQPRRVGHGVVVYVCGLS